MKQLGDKITIIPVADVKRVTSKALEHTTAKRKTDIYLNHNINFVSNPALSDAGKVYNNSLVCYSDIFDKANIFLRQMVIVQLYKTDGKVYNWGSKDYPVSCTITPMGDKLKIELSSSTLQPVIY